MAKKKNNLLKIVPLGGLGEVGKNMTLFEDTKILWLLTAVLHFLNPICPG